MPIYVGRAGKQPKKPKDAPEKNKINNHTYIEHRQQDKVLVKYR